MPIAPCSTVAWLVGAGDPFLATPDYAAYLAARPRTRDVPLTPLAALADALVARGVRAISGGLRTDDSRYEPLRHVASYVQENMVRDYPEGQAPQTGERAAH